MKIVASITNSSMSQSQKLYACWKYVVYGGFYYGGPDPNLYQRGWARSEALRMFSTGYGNCYGFSCIFAALAREVGYTQRYGIAGANGLDARTAFARRAASTTSPWHLHPPPS